MKRLVDWVYWRALRLLPMRWRRSVIYARCHRRFPRRNPVTFSEKLNWRILNDRRPLIAQACDKLATKQLVAGIVDTPATIWSGRDVGELAQVDLPEQWVVKPNHTSGKVHFGYGPADVEELRRVTRDWLGPGHERFMGEWRYSQAQDLLLVEERLGTGDAPEDYKFFVFHGEVKYVHLDSARFSGHTRRLYTPEWEPLGARVTFIPEAPVSPRPATFPEMRRIASELATKLGFDFIRVDLYDVDGHIWLGELTPYHGSGLEAYDPPEFDEQIGSWWTLPELGAQSA